MYMKMYTLQRTHVILCTVKIICDAASIIMNVEAKWPGSVHDSRIYRECSLSNRFACGKEAKALYTFSLSPFLDAHKCVLYNYRSFDGYLLGDREAIPCLLTPYPDRELGAPTTFECGPLQD